MIHALSSCLLSSYPFLPRPYATIASSYWCSSFRCFWKLLLLSRFRAPSTATACVSTYLRLILRPVVAIKSSYYNARWWTIGYLFITAYIWLGWGVTDRAAAAVKSSAWVGDFMTPVLKARGLVWDFGQELPAWTHRVGTFSSSVGTMWRVSYCPPAVFY